MSVLDVPLGFQYWRERYVAFGATDFPGVVGSDVKAIENEYEWPGRREGDQTAFTTAGAVRQTLKDARTERYGPFVGVRWRF